MSISGYQELHSLLFQEDRDRLLKAFSEPLLNSILPEITEAVGCGQGTTGHLEGDVAVHTCLVLAELVSLTKQKLHREADFVERLAVLLHDWKKPVTARPNKDGSVSFPGHAELAAAEVHGIAAKLDLGDKDEAKLYYLVKEHGVVHGFPDLPAERKRELASSPYAQSLAVLQASDARACLLPGGGHLPDHSDLIAKEASQLPRRRR